MLDEGVELLERVLVHQKLDALAGRQLAALVLSGDALDAAAEACIIAALLELLDDFLHENPPRMICGKCRPARTCSKVR